MENTTKERNINNSAKLDPCINEHDWLQISDITSQHISDINQPLKSGRWKGYSPLKAAIECEDKIIVHSLISNTHESRLPGDKIPIQVDVESAKWVADNL